MKECAKVFTQLGKIAGKIRISKCQRHTTIEWMDQNSIGNVKSFHWRKWSLVNESNISNIYNDSTRECDCTCLAGKKTPNKMEQPFEYAANGRVVYLLCQRPMGDIMRERVLQKNGKNKQKKAMGQKLLLRFKWIRSVQQKGNPILK